MTDAKITIYLPPSEGNESRWVMWFIEEDGKAWRGICVGRPGGTQTEPLFEHAEVRDGMGEWRWDHGTLTHYRTLIAIMGAELCRLELAMSEPEGKWTQMADRLWKHTDGRALSSDAVEGTKRERPHGVYRTGTFAASTNLPREARDAWLDSIWRDQHPTTTAVTTMPPLTLTLSGPELAAALDIIDLATRNDDLMSEHAHETVDRLHQKLLALSGLASEVEKS